MPSTNVFPALSVLVRFARRAPLLLAASCAVFVALALPASAEDELLTSEAVAGLAFRELGPAITSGRISDIAVDPTNRHRYFATAASGGVWLTENSGTTWEAVFDDEGSYSIGCVSIDPSNPLRVWVGTGENNSQRSVSYGDGIYRSDDGGHSWENVGLGDSEHIGKILVDPRDSDHVYVAAQGPLWRDGGDRGLYETHDAGATWELSLEIDQYTGVSDIVMDPRDPMVMNASAYQRQRRVWTLIDGGPGSGIYKTVDGGASWDELSNGLPSVDMGRIGLAIAANPDIVYAIVEAAEDASGFYRSNDRGANWSKTSSYFSGSPQYYQEIITDPVDPDRIYSMDTWMHVSEDGGETFQQVGERSKHVDNHALWIDPTNTDYLLAGCDGGVYESYDRGDNWHFKANLPLTQFYKITVDNDTPFYNVYGGTQDNNTIGGPSRTVSGSGITNHDWYITLGGDGFEPQVDPTDPNIIYSQYQHGGLARFDRSSGETLDIQPQATDETGPLKWNWSSALLISPHSHTRLYFGSNILFRSDDRGNSWEAVSGDLTRKLDRNRMEIMGRVWSVDAVWKNRSTSMYGSIVALSESPLVEGLLYAGTDDGLIQVSEDGGASWRAEDSFGEAPELSYVTSITASRFVADRVYATIDAHKFGDFTPYVIVSEDRGRSWKSIASDLPERGQAHDLVEDSKDSNLLFVGTEFGVFFTPTRGERWVQLDAGIPVIACRDLEIQEREDDLVAGTFGRGFYVLDDYSPLRHLNEAVLAEELALLPVKDAAMFVESLPFSLPGKAFMGDSFYAAPNPPVGAVISYHLRDEMQTRKERRHEAELARRESGEPNYYPAWDELRAEDREEAPELVLTVRDADGEVVRRLSGPVTSGTHRVVWDLRYPASAPTALSEPAWRSPWDPAPIGPLVGPGEYSVTLARRADGVLGEATAPQTFQVRPLGVETLAVEDRAAVARFGRETAELQRSVLAATASLADAQSRVKYLRKASFDTGSATEDLTQRLQAVDEKLNHLSIALNGDRALRSRSEATMPSINDRLDRIVWGQWTTSTGTPTKTYRDNLAIASAEFTPVLAELQGLLSGELAAIEAELEAAGGPWTPGRTPNWHRQ